MVIVRADGSGGFAAAPVLMGGKKNSSLTWVAAADAPAPAGTTLRPFRDLAVAYTDRDTAGNVITRLRCCSGRIRSGFNPGQTLELGHATTRSATVADLDDDGVPDLIVSTYANEASTNNGTVELPGQDRRRRGLSSVPGSVPAFPAAVGIRPASVAVGHRAKNTGAWRSCAQFGLAVANALNLEAWRYSAMAAAASFQPTMVTTRLPSDVTLFLPGDFHSTHGANP